MRYSLLLLSAFCLSLVVTCVTSRYPEQSFGKKIQKEVERSPVFNRSFTGFILLDPETGKVLANVNGDKYFTPASNTKILTLATCLELLGDSVPGMQFHINDSVFLFRGTADPTFLHPKFQEWQPAYEQLKNWPSKAYYISNRFFEQPYGPGWAWDDMPEYHSAPRSPFPLYGNTLMVRKTPTGLFTEPVHVASFLVPEQKAKQMIPGENDFALNMGNGLALVAKDKPYPDDFEGEVSFPFSINALEWHNLGDSLGQHISGVTLLDTSVNWRTLYSTPLDTVLRRMMYQSDNFIAEQMLLVCAGQKFDVLRQDTIINWMLDNVFTSLPQRPRWSDGSGLSRYNLISPGTLAHVLLILWKERSPEYLMSLFPANGADDTMFDWFRRENSKPFIFAKTGSMKGVYCLSGYVVTKRGKTLIFSFMHNNFVDSNELWKEETQRVLEHIANEF